MPAGAAPGERRGGRAKGTPNGATVAKKEGLEAALKLAFAALGNEVIDNLSPANMLRVAAHEAAKAGFIQSALSIAKDAAPYFDARPAPVPPPADESDVNTIVIRGGLPNAD